LPGSVCRESRATATKIIYFKKGTSKAKNNLTAGDPSNIACCLSLFAASSPSVLSYSYRLESAKYHRLFERLSVCRESRATATKITYFKKDRSKAKNNLTAGDTSNITCCLSLFAASSPSVLSYSYRLESAKYHRLFERLSSYRHVIYTTLYT